jgi:hypothetical protein
MSGNESLMIEDAGGNAARDAFALTDEQILGIEEESVAPDAPTSNGELAREAASAGRAEKADTQTAKSLGTQDSQQRIGDLPGEAPGWLAERMKDPWVGDEARELWEGAQRAQKDAAAYRDLFATPDDARALKEIYPGGVSEAKAAAERARQLEDLDAAYFGAAGPPAEELSAARGQLVEKLYAQDPAAFREMVAAGMKILQGREAGRDGLGGAREQSVASSSVAAASKSADANANREQGNRSESREGVSKEVAEGYAGFEQAANAELERSVGGAIARTIEEALPNLRRNEERVGSGGRTSVSLQERLGSSVRHEVDAALKNHAQLGDQVAKVLAGKRFGEQERGQVVRLIDARARQLVPGAVRRVVGEWTRTTLTGRGNGSSKRGVENVGETPSAGSESARSERPAKNEELRSRAAQATGKIGRRVDYGKLSDEQILEL